MERTYRRRPVLSGLAALAAAACTQGRGTAGPAPHATLERQEGFQLPPGSGIVKGSFNGEARTLDGAGATFPAALYSKWFTEYQRLTGVQVNYQSIGSGGGIKSISDGTVDFGATDGPMTDEQLKEAKGGAVLHVPMSLGAVVATYNLPGVTQALRFAPDTLAGIFLGEISKWSDARIKADNPSVTLPDRDILTVHRSDGSGTTYIFVDYLSEVSPRWKQGVGKGTSVNWPVGLGGKGNEGVAGEVKANPYSIGYVELIYAIQNRLGVASIRNKVGKWIEPGLSSVTAAAAGAVAAIPADLRASIVDSPGEKAYPISGFTWILAYRTMSDKAKATALTRMLWWGSHDAQQYNAELGYAPLPVEVIKKGEDMIKSITVGGQPAFPNR
jgi:phosphate transport system substrate-binding protein